MEKIKSAEVQQIEDRTTATIAEFGRVCKALCRSGVELTPGSRELLREHRVVLGLIHDLLEADRVLPSELAEVGDRAAALIPRLTLAMKPAANAGRPA